MSHFTSFAYIYNVILQFFSNFVSTNELSFLSSIFVFVMNTFFAIFRVQFSSFMSVMLEIQQHKTTGNQSLHRPLPENIHTPLQKELEFLGGAGFVRPKNSKKCMMLNWNFLRKGCSLKKSLPKGGDMDTVIAHV